MLSILWPCNSIAQIQDQASHLFFPNPTHKTETRSAKGGKPLIATHLDQSNHVANFNSRC
jgi:hypothetical protein